MGESIEYPIGHRPVMPHMLDYRVYNKMVDCICDLFVKEGVSPTHVREITWDLDMFYIWCTLPSYMTSLMHHVFSSLKLIQSFRNHT